MQQLFWSDYSLREPTQTILFNVLLNGERSFTVGNNIYFIRISQTLYNFTYKILFFDVSRTYLGSTSLESSAYLNLAFGIIPEIGIFFNNGNEVYVYL